MFKKFDGNGSANMAEENLEYGYHRQVNKETSRIQFMMKNLRPWLRKDSVQLGLETCIVE